MTESAGRSSHDIFARAVELARAGKRQEAITLFESLLGKDAPQPQVLNALIRLNLEADRPRNAADHMLGLAAFVPEPAQLIADAADTYARAGAFEQAHAAYGKLHKALPGYAIGYFNHAYMLRTAQRYEEALIFYAKALDNHIEQPEEVWLNKAVIYSDHLRDDERAAACLEKALAINPTYLPALINRANLFEEMADRENAERFYRKAAEIDGDNSMVVARLLNLTAGTEQALVAKANKLAKSSLTGERDRASLYYALGRSADAQSDYEAAFTYVRKANEIAKISGPVYDRAESESFINNIIRVFSPEWFERARTASNAAPVFICGMFRSGSTLTEQVIAAHPEARPGGELDYFVSLAHRNLAPFPATMPQQSDHNLHEMAEGYLSLLRERFPKGGVITDKRPDNFLYVGLIKTLFPNARFIHTTRNALDNCLSVYFLELADGLSYAKDLLDTGHYLAQQSRLMAHWKRLFPQDIFTMHYDDFVGSPRTQAQALLSFLGLPWDERCLDFHKLDNTVKTESYWQVRKPLYKNSSGRNKNYAPHVEELARYLNDEGLL